MSVTFAQLGVPPSIVRALEGRGITEPFEIQAAAIADALAGHDVCGRAPTGSGKTLAFGIPLVVNVEQARPRYPRALVLAPTRELAEQISNELSGFSGDVRIGVVYGGVGYGPQLRDLRRGVDILVACPGRLEDLIEQGEVHLGDVEQVVLDEADRMADMGFIPAVRRLLDQTATKRQTVLFSATLDGDVAQLTREYQTDPVRHEVGQETPDITTASHVFWKVSQSDRRQTAAAAVDAVWPAIIFCRTRHGSDRLAKQLQRHGIKAAAIHGGRSQNQRTRALESFAAGRVHALVATDVAARGIHVDGVAAVIHYDPPEDHKTYLNRSGRTARAGEGGVVVSLLQPDQVRDAYSMQKRLGLDEPVTAPDPVELRALSPAPSRPAPSTAERDSNGSDSRSGTSTSGSSPAGRGRRSSKGASRNKSDRGRKGQGGGSRNGSRKPTNQRRGTSDADNSGSGSSSRSAKKRTAAQKGRHGRDNGAGKNKGKPGNHKRTAAANKSNGSGFNGSGSSGSGSKGPNRKARRAHLQPSTPRS